MKYLLFCLLALPLMGEPIWVNRGEAPKGLIRSAYRDTGSMLPALRGGGHFWYLPYSEGVALKKGDWVWVRRASDGAPVLHEITALNARSVYTSGISAKRSDGWSPRSNIVGVVFYVERPAVSHIINVVSQTR